MLKKIFLGLVLFVTLFFGGTFAATNISSSTSTSASSSTSTSSDDCIQLNTDIPGVGKCIKPEQAGDAFGSLMGALMKLAINFVIAIAFISLIAAGIMYSMSGVNQTIAGKGKTLLKKVIIGIVLLGLSGIILHTLNPNFFKTEIYFTLLLNL